MPNFGGRGGISGDSGASGWQCGRVTGTRISGVDEAQRREVADVFRTALLHPPYSDDAWAEAGTSWADMGSWAAWDGDECVGHAGYYGFDTLVPGGRRLPSAGITRVGVLPTHTRRGVLTGLMTDLLLAARADGRVLANLRASEGGIYGRFGFGAATDAEVVEVDTRKARPVIADPGGRCRMIKRDAWLGLLPDLYDRVVNRVGAISRTPWMWERYLHEGLTGSEAHHVVVHTNADGVDDGFVHYSTTSLEEPANWHWGRADVWDLWGTTPRVEVALWDHVVNVDLITLVRVEECPRDLALRAAIADPRACTTRLRYDETWLRVLELDTALRARSYAPMTPLTLAVTDPLVGANNGRWRIGGDGAEKVDGDASGPADLVTDIAGLSAAYLGSSSWWEQCAAGRTTVTSSEVLRHADALFGCRPLAFSGSYF